MSETVSCIMVTGRRNRFIPQALRCFGAQTYQHRELVVVDDGEEPAGRHCEGVSGVKYIRLDRRTPTGRKLNIGIENASGSILQKWDDDDYYAPEFLKTSVARIQESASPRRIAAWDSFLILLAGSTRLYWSGPGWRAGGTICFRRQVWEQAPFRGVAKDEDAFFLEDHAGRPLRIHAPELYVLVRHGANTWDRFRNGAEVDSYVRSLKTTGKHIRDVVADRASARFYERLKDSGALTASKNGDTVKRTGRL
jgi:O-antigen biosynthesis protein